MINFYDFILVFVFTTNFHLKLANEHFMHGRGVNHFQALFTCIQQEKAYKSTQEELFLSPQCCYLNAH